MAVTLAVVLCGAAGAATDAPVVKQDAAKGAPAAAQESAKGAPSTKAETAKAVENRKKPLQRCDELKGEAQLACLNKARERIVDARAKRESKASAK